MSLERAQGYVAQANAILHPQAYGNDILDAWEKLKSWVEAMNLDDMTLDGLHALYHFTVETLLPKLMEFTPTTIDFGIKYVVIPLLTKLHEKYFPHPVPVE